MRRRYRRLQLSCPAIVTVDPGTKDRRIYLLRVVNISTAGAMFQSDLHPAVDTPVHVFLHLKVGREKEKKILRVKFSGKVIRIEPAGFAVSFDEARQSLTAKEEVSTV